MYSMFVSHTVTYTKEKNQLLYVYIENSHLEENAVTRNSDSEFHQNNRDD